jgi:hypothetical protein
MEMQFSLESDKNYGYLTQRLIYIFDQISLIFLKIRNVSDKRCTKNKNTNLRTITFFSKIVPFSDNVENNVEADRPHVTILSTRFACWIHKAKNTHSEYVILIAFSRQQRLDGRASILRYMHIACPVVR